MFFRFRAAMDKVPVVIVILWLLSVAVVSCDQTLEFTDNCPSEYMIQKPDGAYLAVELDEKDCARVDRLRNRKDRLGYTATEDLDPPHMTPVAVNGKYYAQIEVKIAAGSDGKYPRRIFLEMVSYVRTDSDQPIHKKCVRFTITNTTTDLFWDPLQLNFACLELINDKNKHVMLTNQIWSFPSRQSSSLCRQKRSIGGSRTCGVRCSEESVYPLSLAGENEYQLCTCADKHQMKSTVVHTDEQVAVRLEGLPPLIGTIKARIKNMNEETVYTEYVNTTGIRDGRAEFTVTKALAPGNYSLYFDGDCQFSRDADLREMDYKMKRIRMTCRPSDDVHAVTFFDISVSGEKIKKVPSMVISGVLAGVALVGLGTCVTFIFHHHKQKAIPSSDQQNHMENNVEICVMNSPMIETGVSSPLLPQVQTDNVQTDSLLQTEPLVVKLPRIEDTKKVCSHKQSKDTMVMYHPDSDIHVSNVEHWMEKLGNKGVAMECADKENWRDFAEGAVDLYPNIVIFLSAGLIQLCEFYKAEENPAMKNEEFQKLVRVRGYEYSPCIVMEKIRLKIHENPERKDFLVHLITICANDENKAELKTSFFKGHPFLKRTSNVQCYCFGPDDNDSAQQLSYLVANICSLS